MPENPNTSQAAPTEMFSRTVEKEVPFLEFMTPELVEKWGDGIPSFSENDPKSPEWKETPLVPIDLTPDGYGEVLIKNEADRASNPTGTIKDRAAWELATLYRDYARALYLKLKTGRLSADDLKKARIPRLTFVTSGNEGIAVAEQFRIHDLPPPKLIVSQTLDAHYLEALKSLRADVYSVDLTRELTPQDIKTLSNNENGIDITSVRSLMPQAIFYDWHVHEVFNASPDKIFVPYGSGRLAENYLYWQMRTMRNEGNHQRDPRLKVHVGSVISADILAAEPQAATSRADKLSAPFKPFILFDDLDIEALKRAEFTGAQTNRYPVSETHIEYAQDLLRKKGIQSEPSGAASLALYLDRFERGQIKPQDRVVAVNTGEGLYFESRSQIRDVLN